MDDKKLIGMIEELMELDQGTLSAESLLSDIEEYDSMAKLSLIVMMKDEFGKMLSVKQIKEFQTVQDIIDFIHA